MSTIKKKKEVIEKKILKSLKGMEFAQLSRKLIPEDVFRDLKERAKRKEEQLLYHKKFGEANELIKKEAKGRLYDKFANFYDLIYKNKDYPRESDFLIQIINRYKKSKGNQLLEVACGTGNYTQFLKKSFNVTGLDISPNMLEKAKTKNPEVKFIVSDMRNLNLGRKFDTIACMFSSMNYNENLTELEKTLRNFYRHLNDGGIIIFDILRKKEKKGVVSSKKTKIHYDFIEVDIGEGKKLVRNTRWVQKEEFYIRTWLFSIYDKENKLIDSGRQENKLVRPSVTEVKKIMEDIGFKIYIFEDYKEQEYTGKGRPIFVGVKE